MENARALTDNLVALLRREHDAMADFLVALADFDAHRVWAELGYGSLFDFLVRELHVSKGSAQYRKTAAELIQRVPAVIEPLRDGRICFTSIIEAAKVVTAENHETVLPRFFGLSRREAMEIVAALQPHPAPPMRAVVTALRAPPREMQSEPSVSPPSLIVSSTVEPVRIPEQAAPAAPPAEFVPLDAELRRLHVTVSKDFAKKLAAAADARPDLTTEQILEQALDLLLAKAAKAKGIVEKPQRNPRPSKNPDHIPAHVKREVWKRDGARCQWILANGERCNCTRGVEFDHVIPLARGGASTVDNVRLLCRKHNLEAARRVLGDALMDRYTMRARRRPRAAVEGDDGVTASPDTRAAPAP